MLNLKVMIQNSQEVWGIIKRSRLRTLVIEKEDSHLQAPENIFNKTIEENFPNLKKDILINMQEAYRTPKILDQKRKFSYYMIIFKTLNV